MTDLELIIDFHRNTERQGPGSVSDTLRALDFTDLAARDNPQIADIGSGTGGQTITLARHTNAQLTAVDFSIEFLEDLKTNAERAGVSNQISTLTVSMEELPFEKQSLDAIWSEGAIYNIGFEAGVRQWKDYLKPGGFLAVSEITWITLSRPKELEDFWQQAYPEIDLASNKIKQLEDNGYVLTGYFYLPQESWLKSYYAPLEAKYSEFLKRHNNSDGAQRVVKEYEDEIAMYHKFKEYYSYGFYVARVKG